MFNAASAIGFVMGFAMFGALTFLPLFLQNVKGVSPTVSGLRILPLMLGMLGASVISGRLVTRWGRYRIFPILGSALMTLGAYLLSFIDASMNSWVLASYMFIFGVGMGLIMQVLVVAVQNAVSYDQLGVATSSATFFRMIGGSFGTAVFGAIYAIVFSRTIAPTLAKVPPALLQSFNPQALNPALLDRLKSTAEGLFFFDKYIGAVTHAVQTVFLVAVPISFVAFLLSFLLARGAAAPDGADGRPGRGPRCPETRTSLQEIELAIERVAARENRAELYETLAERAGVDLPPRSVWLLYRLAGTAGVLGGRGRREPPGRPAVIQPGVDGLVSAGMIEERRRGGRLRPAPDDGRVDGAGPPDRGAAARAHRTARGLEPRGAPRGDRDGEAARAFAAGRRRATGGRRHAAGGRRGVGGLAGLSWPGPRRNLVRPLRRGAPGRAR